MLQKVYRLPYYAKKALHESMGWALAAPDTWLRRAARYPISQVYDWVDRASFSARPCTYLTSGIAWVGDRPLKVAFIGDWQSEQEPNLGRYERILFKPGSLVREDLGTYSVSHRQQAEKLSGEVDLVAFVGRSRQTWTPDHGNWLAGPAALRLAIDLNHAPTWPDFLGRVNPASEIMSVRGSGMRYSISHRQADFSRFYQQMYLPTMQNLGMGYGEHMPEAAAHALFEAHPFILMIEDADSQPIAGGLIYPWHQAIHSHLTGVVNGNQALIQAGAVAACDYFGLKWAVEAGCKRYDAGLVLPFQTDAAYLARLAVGGSVSRDAWHPDSLLLWAPSGSSAGLAWLKANPMHPQFARPGGDDLPQVYENFRDISPAQSLGQHQEVHLPDVEEDDFQFEAYGSIPAEEKKVINRGLYEHSLLALGPEIANRSKPFGVFVHDQQKQIIGGVFGSFTWNNLHIDRLWVSPRHRGHDLGTRLMKMAENAARLEGADFMTLETTSFEAIRFYPRLGFEIVGQIEDMPPGQTYYYLKKDLRAEKTQP